MRFGEAPAQGVGHAAELFPGGHLVHDPRVTPAMRDRHIHGGETELDGTCLVARLDVGRELAVVKFRLDLVRNELFVREFSRPIRPVLRQCIEVNLHAGPQLPRAGWWKWRGNASAR